LSYDKGIEIGSYIGPGTNIIDRLKDKIKPKNEIDKIS
jgi:hypothetical protein